MNRYFLQFSPLVALLTKGSTRQSGSDFHDGSGGVPAPSYSPIRRTQSTATTATTVPRMTSKPGSWQRQVEAQQQSAILRRWRRAVTRWLAVLRAPKE